MLLKAALALTLIMPVAPGHAQEQQGDELARLAQELQRDVARAWPRAGEIWPGVDFANHVIIITDGRRALAVAREGVTEAPMKDITAPYPGGFDFVTWQGRDAVVLTPYPGESSAELFETGSHEAFHRYVQEGWPSLTMLQGASSRAERYPLRAEPRVFRMQLANDLIAAWTDPVGRAEHLSAAGYWLARWAQQYPDEEQALRATDIAEGSAEYFGMRAAAFARGAAGGREPILKPMRDKNKQYESYAIGAAALLVADQTGQPLKRELSQETRTPAAAVLAGVKPVEQAPAAELAQRVQAQTEAENAALAVILEPYAKAYQEKKPLLLVPASALAGSFQPTGFYKIDGVPGEIASETSAAFDLSTGVFQIDGVTVGMDMGNFVVPIDLEQPGVELVDGKLIISAPKMRGSIQVKEEVTDGRRVLRAQ